MTLRARETLWIEHVNSHPNNDNIPAMLACQPRAIQVMPSKFNDFIFKHNALDSVGLMVITRAWVWRDEFRPDKTAEQYIGGLRHELKGGFDEACKEAHKRGKRIAVIVTNEQHPETPEGWGKFGDWSADILDALAEIPGAWGIVGNSAMGTITQERFDAFMTPKLVATLKAGKGALGIHEYGYVHTAALTRYMVGGVEHNHLAGHFIPETWSLPLMPLGSEAHLIGRLWYYVDLSDYAWLPIAVTEGGVDAVTKEQAQAWGAPLRGPMQNPYSGVNAVTGFYKRQWGIGDGRRFYVNKQLGWAGGLYRQDPRVCIVAHFCTGEENWEDNHGFQEHDLDRGKAGGYFRDRIAASPFVAVIPPWKYAEYVLSQVAPQEPAEEPEEPEEPVGPPEDVLADLAALRMQIESQSLSIDAAPLEVIISLQYTEDEMLALLDRVTARIEQMVADLT